MRRAIVLIALIPLLAACGLVGRADEERYQQASPAMEPAIPAGSTITAEVVAAGRYQPRAGDVVVFMPPAGWDPENQHLPRIYRVVAVPGDTIKCCDPADRLIRNDEVLDEPYMAKGSNVGYPSFDALKIPDGQLYVLGDRRDRAADSSVHGLLPVDSVIGIAKL